MSHTEVIVDIIRNSGYKTYLELGVYIGDTLGLVSKIVDYHQGVDINHHPIDPSLNMFYGSTKSFFEQNKRLFDCIFIDADHSALAVEEDLKCAFMCLSKGGLIILHDTNPERKELLPSGYCGDCYKIHDFLENHKNTFNYITLPMTEAGLTLVTKKHEERYRDFV